MREIIRYRDGNQCQIKGIEHACSITLCADHRPAKRGKHATFFDPRNLTLVCATANWLAERDPFISNAILDVVKKREGQTIVEDLRSKARKTKTWKEDEINVWLATCDEWFKTKKCGIPDV